MDGPGEWMIDGERLAALLLETREAFLQPMRQRGKTQDYLGGAQRVIEEFARFCRSVVEASPWLLRQQYLEKRPALRVEQPYSAGYLRKQRQHLAPLVQWYRAATEAGEVDFGQLPTELMARYWSTREGVHPLKQKIIDRHLPCLRRFLRQLAVEDPADPWERLLSDYFEERRLVRRGGGHRSRSRAKQGEIVTRQHLVWLERAGRLPAGTARGAAPLPTAPGDRSPAERRRIFAAKVDPELPVALRQPLQQHLELLVDERQTGETHLYHRLRPTLALCRHLAADGVTSFAGLRVKHLDAVVSSLLTAPPEDLLRRRRQVQRVHGHLRGFLHHLQQHGLLHRDLASALISPPCYGAREPPLVLSAVQVQALLDSVDRDCAKGRRSYAILQLLTTYGLRPIDVAQLKLEALCWREERLTLVQKKTGKMLTLPLLPAVAEALVSYLQQDRNLQVEHREVFLSLLWPHRPLSRPAITELVRAALRQAGLGQVTARHLRASVATQMLRQGEALSTIQEVLGQCTADTTQHYAVTDVELLREVLEEAER